ncbi:hypothetical protein EDD17DRAFT_1573215 [Pisolithus thermaeus]|nr:hypothetical protein EDD17DRAFT_1573215 [Pisolithus thermaeus]
MSNSPLISCNPMNAAICLVLLGVPSLDELEKIVNKNKNKKNQKDDTDQEDDKYQKNDKEQKDEEDHPKWPELRKDLTDRTNNVNVVAALVVASAAVFLSAPFPTPISRWDPVFPYFCMLLGFGAAMLAIVSGFVQVVLLSAIGPEDIRLAKNARLIRWPLFFLLGLPLSLLLLASSSVGAGFMGAIWLGDVLWIKLLLSVGYGLFLFFLILSVFLVL